MIYLQILSFILFIGNALVYMFTNTLSFYLFIGLELFCGLLYTLFWVFNFRTFRVPVNSTCFEYWPSRISVRWIISLSLLLLCSGFLVFHNSRLQSIAWVGFIYAGILIFQLSYRKIKRNYAICISDQELWLHQDRIYKISATAIASVVLRHGAYFITQGKTTYYLSPEYCPQADAFKQALNDWLEKNRVKTEQN